MTPDQNIIQWAFGIVVAIIGFFVKKTVTEVGENKAEIAEVKLDTATNFVSKADWRVDLERLEAVISDNTKEIKAILRENSRDMKDQHSNLWKEIRKKADK
ncbi:hypothetical protein OAF54_00900 [bacterium]|nr:hypothetical protein [bacterium]